MLLENHALLTNRHNSCPILMLLEVKIHIIEGDCMNKACNCYMIHLNLVENSFIKNINRNSVGERRKNGCPLIDVFNYLNRNLPKNGVCVFWIKGHIPITWMRFIFSPKTFHFPYYQSLEEFSYLDDEYERQEGSRKKKDVFPV